MNAKLPVISSDAWEPAINPAEFGRLRAMLKLDIAKIHRTPDDAKRKGIVRKTLTETFEHADCPHTEALAAARLIDELANTGRELRRRRHFAFIIDATASRNHIWDTFQKTTSVGLSQLDGLTQGKLALSLLSFGGDAVHLAGTANNFRNLVKLTRDVTPERGGTRFAESIDFLAKSSAVANALLHDSLPENKGMYVDALILMGDSFIDGSDVAPFGSNTSPVLQSAQNLVNYRGEQTPVLWFRDASRSTSPRAQQTRDYQQAVCEATRGHFCITSEQTLASTLMGTLTAIIDPTLVYGLIGDARKAAEKTLSALTENESPLLTATQRMALPDLGAKLVRELRGTGNAKRLEHRKK